MNASLMEVINAINTRDNTLFILCGLPYSGKTYIAKSIVESTDCAFVSIDDLFHQSGYDWDSNKLPDKEGWNRIFKASYSATQDALKASKNVLYDSTNHTRASRDRLRSVAQSVGAQSVVIFVDVPTSVIFSRWESNSSNPTRSVVAKELVQQTIDSFEKPTSDENVLVVNGQ